MGAGVAFDQVTQRRVDGLGVRGRQPDRHGDAERVAQPGGVLGSGQASLAGDADLDRPASLDQLGRPAGGECVRAGSVDPSDRGRGDTGGELLGCQRTQHPQQVVQLVGVTRAAFVGEPLQLELDPVEDLGIEQRAQLLGAQQVAQQLPVERQRRRRVAPPAARRPRT